MNLLVQGRCSNSSQCHFYENCVEHFTGQCLGQCELSSWFTHVILWFVFSFLLVFVICIKCDCWCCRMIFCANYRQMHRHQPYRFSRRSTPMNIPGIGKQHQTNSPSINMSTFHEIVLARNLSNDQYWNIVVTVFRAFSGGFQTNWWSFGIMCRLWNGFLGPGLRVSCV